MSPLAHSRAGTHFLSIGQRPDQYTLAVDRARRVSHIYTLDIRGAEADRHGHFTANRQCSDRVAEKWRARAGSPDALEGLRHFIMHRRIFSDKAALLQRRRASRTLSTACAEARIARGIALLDRLKDVCGTSGLPSAARDLRKGVPALGCKVRMRRT